jgi:hypothetical protein
MVHCSYIVHLGIERWERPSMGSTSRQATVVRRHWLSVRDIGTAVCRCGQCDRWTWRRTLWKLVQRGAGTRTGSISPPTRLDGAWAPCATTAAAVPITTITTAATAASFASPSLAVRARGCEGKGEERVRNGEAMSRSISSFFCADRSIL